MNNLDLPLLQEKQAAVHEACGFPCTYAGEFEFAGEKVKMWQPTGEGRTAKAGLIGAGGAAFGGKTFGDIALAKTVSLVVPGVTVGFFRRTYPELFGPNGAVELAYQIFGDDAEPHDGGKHWTFANGSQVFFLYVQHEKDVYKYQSQAFEVLIPDEATHFSWRVIDYLLTRNRVSKELPSWFEPFALLTSNPGNIGHAWYAQVFDLALNKGEEKEHEQVKEVINPNGKTVKTYFIPAFLEDNQIGVARDPGYEQRLMDRHEDTADALRWGRWWKFAGQMFPTWIKQRVACEAFDIPDWWAKWRASDYGFSHPWAAGWFTQDPDSERIYIYRAIKKDGLTDRQQARLIKRMSPDDELYVTTYGGHDFWSPSGKGVEQATCSADEYRNEGVPLTKADVDRVGGVKKIHRLLRDLPDGKGPGLQVFEEYYDVFDSMPVLIRDEKKPEDVKKVDGDDDFDMLKYGLTNTQPKPRKPKKTVPVRPLSKRTRRSSI